ncbi:uncharacterized protein LOC110441238 [Mizuhopecten yessoensis]|uniref:uncharacterized protein LOC110441238 n=1 Tax=Mizuhopecten yessoensis TaxID=6573 RepID=UPI000B45B7EA|nr:uncharacterized protein LOC110441238 [Mizuhopecten yessoensis]
MFFQRSGRIPGPCPVFIKSKLSVKQTFIAAVIVTLLCVIGIILCIVGLVTKGLAYAGAGFALAVIALVIIMLLLVCCRVNAKKNFRNAEHTETNLVNPNITNVTGDEKGVKKGETTDVVKETEVETKGSDKNDKVDKKGEKTNVIKATALEMKGIDKNDKVDDV